MGCETRVELRSMFAIGGIAAIVGSVLGGVGNLIHPVTRSATPRAWPW